MQRSDRHGEDHSLVHRNFMWKGRRHGKREGKADCLLDEWAAEHYLADMRKQYEVKWHR